MKAKITLLLIVCFALTSCSKWYYWQKHHNDDDDGGGNDDRQTVEISDNQIIVRFEPDVPEKDRIKLRNDFGVGENFEPCSCGDLNLELWGIDPGAFNIEGVVDALRGESEAEGDFQFSFSLPRVGGFETFGAPSQSDIATIASSTPDGNKVNIAVLDTGIDYGRPFAGALFSTPYLFQTAGLSDCTDDIAGWNFSDPVGNGNILDDNGHGTYVTKIITSTLDAKGVGYRILPVKVFNDMGQGSYWAVLCAVGYLQRIQAEAENIGVEGATLNIINASFGGTIENQLFDKKGLLNMMIEELADTGVSFVASAGNDMKDTDGGPLKHFPSGYAADNILAVGGYEVNGDGDVVIHPKSNYGIESIDIAATYEDWKVSFDGQPDVDLFGTSYSAAYITGLLSDFYIKEGRPGPIELKINFLNDSNTKVSNELKPNINEGRYVE